MKNPIIFSIVLFYFMQTICLSAFGQNTEKYVSAEELIDKGIELYDSGDYEQALIMFDRINPNDDQYPLSVYEKALTYTALKNPEAALKAIFSLKKYPGSVELIVYNLTGNNLDDLNREEEALKIYSEGYAKYQHTFLLPYNYALTLYKKGDFDRAAEILDKSIRINPYHFNSHILLGAINYAQGYLVPALLCFSYATSVTSDENAQYQAYKLFETALNGNLIGTIEKESKGKVRYEAASDEKNMQYAELDFLLRSKAATENQFKPKTKIDYPALRQLQFLVENVKAAPEKKDIFNQLHIPYFNELLKNEHLEAFIYDFVAFSDNKDVRKTIKKNKSKIEKLYAWANKHVGSERARLFNPDEKKRYTFGKTGILSAGIYADADFQVPTGDWLYYRQTGCKEAEGTFENGLKQGAWKYYDENGNLTKIFNFQQDKENGEAVFYNGNGVVSEKSGYVDGEISGKTIVYNSSGIREREMFFDNGSLSGKCTDYFNNGHVMFDMDYLNDKINGEVTLRNANKTPRFTGTYKNDHPDGTLTYYYDNGQIKNILSYKDSILSGEQKSYHPNGVLSKSYTTNDKGEIVGIYTEYRENGLLSDSVQYNDNGIPVGTYYSYDKSGNLLFTIGYDKKGNAKSYTFYDKEGKITSESREKDGVFILNVHDIEGRLRQTGVLKDGKKDGTWKHFNPFGYLEKEVDYKNDEINGKSVEYYPSTGKISESISFVDGEYNGLYVKYYANGQTERIGYLIQGNKEGAWKSYFSNGKLHSEEYFKKDEHTGEQVFYTCEGKKHFSEFYEYGYLSKQTYYDENEEILSTCELNLGNGTLTHHVSGKQKIVECEVLGGKLNGNLKKWNVENRLLYDGNFIENLEEGIHIQYDNDGRKVYDCNFVSGKFHGTRNFYSENGKIETVMESVLGTLRRRTDYHENGKMSFQTFFNENKQRDGLTSYYDETGTLIHSLIFENGTITGYVCSDKSGNSIEKKLTGKDETVEMFYPSGIKSAEMHFVNGVKDGNIKRWHSNGKLYQNRNYENDYNSGLQEEFSMQEVLLSSENYLSDSKHGSCKYYYETGVLKSEEEYMLGNLHGTCKYYSPNGKLRCTRVFYNNSLISESKGE